MIVIYSCLHFLPLLLFSCSISHYACSQISKLSMIPVVCVMERILHNKHFSRKVKISVVAVVIGVGVCTVTDVKVNLKGFTCACLAVFSTSLQQIVSIMYYLCFVLEVYMKVFAISVATFFTRHHL